MEKKLRNVFQRGISLFTSAFVIVLVSQCKSVPGNSSRRVSYEDYQSNYSNEYCKSIAKEDGSFFIYKADNVFLIINKETFEVKEYISDNGSLNGNIYDVSTGYMINDSGLFDDSNNFSNEKLLKENNYIVWIRNVSDYIEDEEVKDWYTIEEIKELEPAIIESLKIINEYEGKVKVK